MHKMNLTSLSLARSLYKYIKVTYSLALYTHISEMGFFKNLSEFSK